MPGPGSATVTSVTQRIPVGLPFASGREADVFALGDGRVLRRYRGGEDVTQEAAVMAYAAGLHFPVPGVYEASGTDLVLERLDGPTLARALLAGDLPLDAGAEIMADLLRRLHALPPRDSDGIGAGIVHLDLHPENILLTGHGPVLIDWRNAGDGPGDLDTALTALIIAQVAIGSIDHELGSRAGALLDLFLERAPGDPLRLLGDAVDLRSRQLTMSAEEVGMLPTAAARVRGVM